MIGFILLVVLMVLAALAVILVPLLRPALKSAAGNAAPDEKPSWGLALTISIALPLAAVALYLALGQPAAFLPREPAPPRVENQQSMAVINALSKRLQQDGANAEGWLLLARSYRGVGRIQDALAAYKKTLSLQPDNADLLVEYANTLGVANNRNLLGEPSELIDRALRIDPDNLNALALSGAAAMQSGHNRLAVRHWQRLEALIPADSPDHPRIQALIARAQGKPAPASAVAAMGRETQAAENRRIRGTITVSAALADRVSPSDTLFVFARVPGGPPMPLAAVRKPAAGWPIEFELDDSTAMIQGMKLSAFERVNIIARVSRLGNASPQPGDLEGRLENISLGSAGIHVVLDKIVGG